MNLHEYLEQVKLNKEDPDYQIEEFWYGFKNSIVFGSIESSLVKSFKILKISKTFSWLYSGIFRIYFIFSTSLLSLSYYLVKTSKDLFNKDFTALLVPFTVLQLLSACS